MSEDTRSTYKDRKSKEKIAWITGICMIIAAVIGTLSVSINVNTENEKLKKDYEEVISENTDLSNQTNEAQEAYNKLNTQYESLVSQNNDLQDRISSLENELSQYASFIEENESLKNQLNEYANLVDENNNLKSELKNIQNEIEQLREHAKNQGNVEEKDINESSGKKISIFNLPISKGDTEWRVPFSDDLGTGTDGVMYPGSRWAIHCATSKDNTKYTFTYSLDKKYSTCEGGIVWSSYSKNVEGSAWIEFYSGDELIYTTDAINANSEPFYFNFKVQNVDRLTIVRNSTTSHTSYYQAYIIYPYLNLIE